MGQKIAGYSDYFPGEREVKNNYTTMNNSTSHDSDGDQSTPS